MLPEQMQLLGPGLRADVSCVETFCSEACQPGHEVWFGARIISV